MKIKSFTLGLVFLSFFTLNNAPSSHDITVVFEDEAFILANNWLSYVNEAPLKGKLGHYEIRIAEILTFEGMPLCYIYHLNPTGHLVLSTYQELNPIRSFSFHSDFIPDSDGYEKVILGEIKAELNFLMKGIKVNAQITSAIGKNKKCWIFWMNLNADKNLPIIQSIREKEIEIKKREGILFSRDSEMGSKLEVGKFFSPFAREAISEKASLRRMFTSNTQVAKYYQHFHRNLHRMRLETNFIHSREIIKIKSADISLVSNSDYAQSDYSGDLVLTGAVKNNGTTASVFTKINVALYDKNGDFIGSDSTYINGGTNVKLMNSGVYINALLPGEKGFFKIWTSYDYSNVGSWQFAFDWDEYSYSLCNAELEFDGDLSFSSDYSGDLYISGKIKNTSSNYVSYFSQVYFAIYNADSKVIEVDSTYVDGDSYDLGWTTTDTAIYPDQSWPFDTYTNAPFDQYSSYEYSLEWNEAQTGVSNYTISGRVTEQSGGGLSGVTMSGLPGNPTTDSSGNYSAKVESGWSGTVTPTKTGYTFSPSNRSYSNVGSDQLNEDYTASAVQHTLTISAGTGGTTDPSPGTYTYDSGTTVTITAIPDSGFIFGEWSGDASGKSNPITITMDSNKTVTAEFTSQYTLSINSSEGGTTNPSPGTYTYDSGTEVTIKATPEDNCRFKEWSGDASGTDNPITIKMDSNKSVTATFIRQYTLTISTGTGGTTDPSPGTYTHDSGANVTAKAIANTGYNFSGWSGDASGTTNPITITMDKDKTITASFKATSSGDTGGGDSGGGGGCFIATACYGSPMADEVKTLCAFRDQYLLTDPIGQSLVRFYYGISPTVADFIREKEYLRAIVREFLRPIVWIITLVTKVSGSQIP